MSPHHSPSPLEERCYFIKHARSEIEINTYDKKNSLTSHWLTDSLTHSLPPSLPLSLTHSLTLLLTYSLTHYWMKLNKKRLNQKVSPLKQCQRQRDLPYNTVILMPVYQNIQEFVWILFYFYPNTYEAIDICQ